MSLHYQSFAATCRRPDQSEYVFELESIDIDAARTLAENQADAEGTQLIRISGRGETGSITFNTVINL